MQGIEARIQRDICSTRWLEVAAGGGVVEGDQNSREERIRRRVNE